MGETLRYTQIRLDEIEVVSNIRQEFDDEKMAELTASVKENGILQPLVVVKTDGGKSRLIVGERRLRAARAAGLEAVPVTVVDEMTEEEVLEAQIAENLQRDDISAIEEAEAYRKLIETCGLNQAQVAAKIGVDPSQVSNRLRLLRLPASTRNKILRRQMTAGHGIALLRVLPKGDAPPPEIYATVEEAVSAKEMSVQEAENAVDRYLWQFCKSLTRAGNTSFKNSYNPFFDPKKECKGCLYAIEVKPMLTGTGATDTRCLKPACWQEKQDRGWAEIEKARKAKEAEARKETTVGGGRHEPDADEGEDDIDEDIEDGGDGQVIVLTAAPTIEAAPPLENLDPRRAEQLGKAAWAIAGPVDDRSEKTVEYRRECYLTIQALFKHFADRTALDKGFDRDFETFTATIPEQGLGFAFEIYDYDQEEPVLQVEDDEFILTVGQPGNDASWIQLRDAAPVGPAYYCLTALRGKWQTIIRQRLAIPLKGRTLVIAAVDRAVLKPSQRAAWYDLVQALPAAPVSCALDQEPGAEEDEDEDEDDETSGHEPTEVGDNPEEDEEDE